MSVQTIAPAKVNWTLEVLGKRPDGYHEVRTVMQTIDICDEVTVEQADELRVAVEGPHLPGDDDDTLQAARMLGRAMRREFAVSIHVRKRIPVSAGLGGGSSDAAAVLRGLAALYGLEGWDREMVGVAADIGSDVAFFLRGGTSLCEGRGEKVTPLPDAPRTWLVVMAPPIVVADKTRRMYSALKAVDFSGGHQTAELVTRVRSGQGIRADLLCNAFERAALEVFEGLSEYREVFREAAGGEVHLAGAGPGMFSVHASREEAEDVAARLLQGQGQVFVARTLKAAEATRMQAGSRWRGGRGSG